MLVSGVIGSGRGGADLVRSRQASMSQASLSLRQVPSVPLHQNCGFWFPNLSLTAVVTPSRLTHAQAIDLLNHDDDSRSLF